MGYSTAQPGGSRSVASWFSAEQRGFAMGIRQAGLPLGGAAASAVLPALAAAHGWRAAPATGAAAALLAALAFGCLYRSPGGGGVATAATAPSPPPRPRRQRLRAQLAGRLRMAREPAMARIVLSGVSLISVQYGVVVLCVLSLHERQRMSPGRAALVLFAAQGAGVVGRVVLAAWSDRAPGGRYRPVLVCLAAAVGGLALLGSPVGGSQAAAVALFLWLGFFGFGWYGPWVAHVAESAPPARGGFALGLAMAVNQIAVIAVPPLLGVLRDATGGYTPGWWALAACAAAAFTLTFRARGGVPLLRRRTSRCRRGR